MKKTNLAGRVKMFPMLLSLLVLFACATPLKQASNAELFADRQLSFVAVSAMNETQKSALKLTGVNGEKLAGHPRSREHIQLPPGRYTLTYYVLNNRSNAGWKYAYVDTPATLAANLRYFPTLRIDHSSVGVWTESGNLEDSTNE